MKQFDKYTEKHFQDWLDRTIYDDEREAVETSIRKLIMDHPDYLGDKSWPELRNLARKYITESRSTKILKNFSRLVENVGYIEELKGKFVSSSENPVDYDYQVINKKQIKAVLPEIANNIAKILKGKVKVENTVVTIL